MKTISIMALAVLGCLSSQAMAAISVTADYDQLNPAEATNPVTFDKYQFGTGDLLLDITSTSGNSKTGTVYFQSFVSSHYLGSNGAGPGLADVNNAPYELTVSGQFDVNIVGFGINNVSVSQGSFDIWYDPNPNRSFTGTGTGFTDGSLVLSGVIDNGYGSYTTNASGNIDLGITLLLSTLNANPSVYSPQPSQGQSIFSLSASLLPSGATGVNGITPNGPEDKLAGATGDLVFTAAVPLPAAAFLLAPVLLAGFGWQSCRQSVC